MPPAATLVKVYAALLALLAITAAAPFLFASSAANGVSLAVAVAKAALIGLYFMRIRYESPRVRVLSLAALAWACFLFALVAADYLARGWGGIPGK